MMNLRRRIAATRLAAEFLQELIEEIGEMKFRLACQENVRAKPDVCASHDWCDANVVMDAAWRNCFDAEGAEESSMRLNYDDDLELWGYAWNMAKLWMSQQVGRV